MALRNAKTLIKLAGALLGALLAMGVVLGVYSESWLAWAQVAVAGDTVHPALNSKPETEATHSRNPQGELKIWHRLPAQAQGDNVLLGLTQVMQALGLRVLSLQVVAPVGKAKPQDPPELVLSMRVLATYAQWVQLWASLQQEGMAWWPVQLSMGPAPDGAHLQIEGHWRVALSDQPSSEEDWTRDVDQWSMAAMEDVADPFGVHLSTTRPEGPMGHDAKQACAKNSLQVPMHSLQLVGVVQSADAVPARAVIRAGACQWVVQVGQRISVQGHVLQAVGPGAMVEVGREGAGAVLRLHVHTKESS